MRISYWSSDVCSSDLAVTSAVRASALPDVPTVAEQGLLGFEASIWFAMFGPANLPDEVVLKKNAAINSALADPEVQAANRQQRSEERREGNEGGSTCRSRWTPDT